MSMIPGKYFSWHGGIVSASYRPPDKTPFPSHFSQEKNKQFYRTFIKAMFPLGLIRLMHLTLNKTIDLSMFLSLQCDDTLFLYTTSFNDEYAKCFPETNQSKIYNAVRN